MEKNKLSQVLQKFSLLSSFSETEIDAIASKATLLRATKYQFIYMPDEKSEFVHFLVSGRLKSGCFAADGREVIKEILKPIQVFGEMSLTGEEKRPDFVQAIDDEVLYVAIPAADLRPFMQESPRFMTVFLDHLRNKLGRVEDRLSALVLKDARSRIIDFLVDTANKDGKQIGYEMLIRHHLTQQDIANLTGTSRQTVTSVLNDLKRTNRIYFTRTSILIRDMANLA